MSVWAVLVAAGRGERLGEDRPKAFVRLGDLPLLAEPLRRLDQSEWIDAVVVVVPPEWEEPAILLAEEIGASKVTACVTGGATRSESVRAGVAEVPEDAAVILVHDAARPVLPDEVIERVIRALADGFEGAVPALPVPTPSSVSTATLCSRPSTARSSSPSRLRRRSWRPRSELASSQHEPQRIAHRSWRQAGGRVRIVKGDERLLKVTTPADLARVAAWL